jgi:hypothetical protein
MGWKNIKEHYKIGHIVQVTSEGICIGSPYIHNIIVIGLDGELKRRYDDRSNEDLSRYQSEMAADPEKLKRLIDAPDAFSRSVPVYTFDGGEIIKKRCEELKWPNVTHDGEMMYDNTFSADKDMVVQWAKEDAAGWIKLAKKRVEEVDREAVKAKERLATWEANLVKLERDYPGMPKED